MKFYAFHGCFAEEQAIGTHFSVDVAMNVDTTKAQVSDSLDDTVSYLDVYQVMKREMMIPSHLLEHVAERMANSVLDEFRDVESIWIRVNKLNPPLGGQMDSVSVEIEKCR